MTTTNIFYLLKNKNPFFAAPSPVRELLPRNIGNTTVDLIWMPPEFFNGVLQTYKISINSEIFKIEPNIEITDTKYCKAAQNNDTSNERIRYTCYGLRPYEDYNVAVSACTSPCSNWTQSSFRTEMGAPGNFKEQPYIESQTRISSLISSNLSLVLKWKEPEYKGGKLDFYEVQINFTSSDGKTPSTTTIHKMKSMQCIFDKLCSDNKRGSAVINVRGVNFFLSPHRSEEASKIDVHAEIIGGDPYHNLCDSDDPVLVESLEKVKKYDNHSQYFYGPWSPPSSHTCGGFGNHDSQNIILVMFLTIVSILFVGMIFYLYRKIRDIKNIIVEFPPGLEDLSSDKVIKKNKNNPFEIPDIINNVDNSSLANEDEHKRLLRRSMNGSFNGDCNSSINSENTRTEMDQNDEIEYNDFGGMKHYEMSDNDNIDGRLQVSKI